MSSDEAQKAFILQTVYLKDMSVEQPNSPAIFLERQAPALDVAVNIGFDKIDDATYESLVTVTLTAKVGEKVAYLVEGKQAGIFNINGYSEEELDLLLGIKCPSIVYPYLRAHIADMVGRAGFPPVHLAEINFEAYYQERLAHREAETANEKPLEN